MDPLLAVRPEVWPHVCNHILTLTQTDTQIYTCIEKLCFMKTLLLDCSYLGQRHFDWLIISSPVGQDAVQTVT